MPGDVIIRGGRRRQETPGGARRRQEAPGDAKRHQEAPGKRHQKQRGSSKEAKGRQKGKEASSLQDDVSKDKPDSLKLYIIYYILDIIYYII